MKVIDNFLNEEICNLIIEDTSFFPMSMGDDKRIASEINSYHSEQADCFAPYMFWQGWGKSEPKSIKQLIVKCIWENNLPFPIDELCGFEYWTRTFNPGQFLGPHVDEDTFRYAKTKILTGPKIGCVYYGPETDVENGGFLEIYPHRIDDFTENALESDVVGQHIVDIDRRERIACKANRLIIFDAGHVLHGTSPASSGKRNVMIINVWHNSVVPTALKTGEFYYE
jgi:hypothetical protein